MYDDIGGWTRHELAAAGGPYRRWARREMRARRVLGFLFLGPDCSVEGSGVVWLQPAQPRPGRLARGEMPYIMSMYVEPAARGRGIASALVREMIRWAERRGYRRIFLHASKSGRPVYARLGFVEGNEMRLDLPIARHGRR